MNEDNVAVFLRNGSLFFVCKVKADCFLLLLSKKVTFLSLEIVIDVTLNTLLFMNI